MIDYVNWTYIIADKIIIYSVNCVYINMFPLKCWIKVHSGQKKKKKVILKYCIW